MVDCPIDNPTETDPLRLFEGNCLDLLHHLAVHMQVQTIVTSPPYYGLRDYGIPPVDWTDMSYTPAAGLPSIDVPKWRGCLGHEPTIVMYVAHMVWVFRQLRYVLKDDGTVWLNLGDSYSRPAKWGGSSGGKGHDSYDSRHYDQMRIKRDSPGLKAKDLMMVPARVALALQAEGWYLRSEIVWEKTNCLPESVDDRPTGCHEKIFLLVKQEKYYCDMEAIREGDNVRDRKGNKVTARHEQYDDAARFTKDIVTVGRNKRNVWPIAASTGKPTEHCAAMPEKLVEPCILAGSRPGDIVLDPFAGSGTVLRVALAHRRLAVGIEIKPEYCEQIRLRTDQIQTRFVG